MKNRNYFFFVYLYLLGLNAAFATPVAPNSSLLWPQVKALSSNCNLILNHEEDALRRIISEEVDANLSERLKLIQNSNRQFSATGIHPAVLNSGKISQIDVTNALFLQYGQSIIVDSRTQMNQLLTRLIENWKTAYRPALEASYKEKTNFYTDLIQKRVIQPSYHGIFPVPLYENEPLFPYLSKYLNESGFKEKMSKALNQRIEARILENRSYKLAEARDLEIALAIEMIAVRFQPKLEQFKALGTRSADLFGDTAAKMAEQRAPTGMPGQIATWAAFTSLDPKAVAREWFTEVPKIADEIVNELRTQFPIGSGEEKPVISDALARIAQIHSNFAQEVYRDSFSADGLTLNLRSARIHSQYNSDLGTTLLTTSADPTEKNPTSPIFLLLHGAGTTRSHDGSWKALQSLYEANGFNSIAPGLPIAAIGPEIRGAPQEASYIDRVAEYVKKNFATKTLADGSTVELPIIAGGRSMGSSLGFLHNSLYGGEKNPIDLYWLMSYSNPRTIDFQVESVNNQVKAGLFSGVIKESLDNASEVLTQNLQMLEKAKKANPEAFAKGDSNNNVLLFQGDADADGGPTVINDLRRFCNDFCPTAHIFEFHLPENQRKFYEQLMRGEKAVLESGTAVTEDMFEATHFIQSNTVDNELSAPRAQTIQSFAAIYGFMDYMADGIGPNQTWPNARDRESQRKFKAYRARTTTDGESLFDWYVKQKKIDLEKVNSFQNPQQNTRDYAERMAYVKAYWQKEKQRIIEWYQQNRLN